MIQYVFYLMHNLFACSYSIHPRQFQEIAAAIGTKITADVVSYYYANKITLNLKHIVKRQAKKRRRVCLCMQTNSCS